ncbi:iron-sulfur cluster assembly scaffold protein [Phenylobacterium sp.]|jgi:NifU-like protein involved in Fe-S cluster formation|uniref:iron-sulfur cluster assembly scaffold protein n=1 Tax=Phenylobacterium sp. TaxID=1871053 RepID=UPI002F3E331C
MIDDLYSGKLLALAANMPRVGRLAAPDASVEKVAKLCGSRVLVDVKVEGDRVADFAQEVKACALGQAAASVLGAHVVGASLSELELARDQFRAMLKEGAAAPDGRFSDLAMLSPVKDYPARHASTLLAFEAVTEAVRTATGAMPDTSAERTSPAGAA